MCCTNIFTTTSTVLEYTRVLPGSTAVAEHLIPTTGTPVKVPLCRIPGNYHLHVEKQIQIMLEIRHN